MQRLLGMSYRCAFMLLFTVEKRLNPRSRLTAQYDQFINKQLSFGIEINRAVQYAFQRTAAVYFCNY